jgi:hypothetical protein
MSNYVKATNFTAKDTLPTGNAGKIVKGAEIDTEFTAIASAISSKADSNSPTFTGTPTTPTAASGTNTTQVASTAFVVAERTAEATLTNKTLTSPIINEIIHEGTADAFETTLAFTDPTADRTITFPNKSGTVATTADLPTASAIYSSSGTYSIAGTTTLTVTATGHGRAVGDVIYLNFTSGTAVDGYFTIATVADVNTFTVTYGSSITTSGNVSGYYSNSGTIPLASNAETIAGISDIRAVSPASLVAYVDNRFTSSGAAPNFLARMWVYFSGAVDADLFGTWSRSGTTVTVTMTDHKFVTGNRGYLNFNATVADGVYEITRVDANTFTVVSATSGTASGTVTSTRQTIYGSGNVSVISRNTTGDYIINFEKDMPSANYGFSFVSSSSTVRIDTSSLPTATGFRIQCLSGSTAVDGAYISALVVG